MTIASICITEHDCLNEGKLKKNFVFQGSNERSNGANGSVPQMEMRDQMVEAFLKSNGNVPQGQGGRADVEEERGERMMNHQETGLTNRRVSDQEDFVRVVRGVLGNNGNVMNPAQPQNCSKLDIIRMDCPGADDDHDDLLKVVKGLLDKESQQNKDEQIRREWRMLAEQVDRVLFWSFLFITTVSTLLFLVILPFYHRGKFF